MIFAAQNDYMSMVEYLVERGANPTVQNLVTVEIVIEYYGTHRASVGITEWRFPAYTCSKKWESAHGGILGGERSCHGGNGQSSVGWHCYPPQQIMLCECVSLDSPR